MYTGRRTPVLCDRVAIPWPCMMQSIALPFVFSYFTEVAMNASAWVFMSSMHEKADKILTMICTLLQNHRFNGYIGIVKASLQSS